MLGTIPWRLLVVCLLVASCVRSAGDSQAPGATFETVAKDILVHSDPLSLLDDGDPQLAANKRLVFDMWRGIVNAGHIELADELLAEGYIQHSPVLPTGRDAFKQIFSAVPRLEAVPELVSPPLVAMVAEGDRVIMAMREELPRPDGKGDYASVHFNLFRIADHRLAEHWHSVQGTPSPQLPFAGEGGPLPVTGVTGKDLEKLADSADPALAANKRLVLDLWQTVRRGGRSAAKGFLAASYLEHNVNGGEHAPPFRGFSDPRNAPAAPPVLDAPAVALVAEGEFVVLVTALEHPDPRRAGTVFTSTWFDMFRIADGKISEHWDAAIIPGTVVPFGG